MSASLSFHQNMKTISAHNRDGMGEKEKVGFKMVWVPRMGRSKEWKSNSATTTWPWCKQRTGPKWNGLHRRAKTQARGRCKSCDPGCYCSPSLERDAKLWFRLLCFCNSYLGKTGRRSIPITTATTDAEWKGKAATSILTVHSHGFDGMGKAKLSVRPRLWRKWKAVSRDVNSSPGLNERESCDSDLLRRMKQEGGSQPGRDSGWNKKVVHSQAGTEVFMIS